MPINAKTIIMGKPMRTVLTKVTQPSVYHLLMYPLPKVPPFLLRTCMMPA